MIKPMVFTFIWAATFFIVSGVLLLVAWRVYFAMTGAPTRRPSEDAFMWLGISAAIIPLLLGGIGATLGIRGVLPGTRRRRDESE